MKNKILQKKMNELARSVMGPEFSAEEELGRLLLREKVRQILNMLYDKAPYIYAFFRKAPVSDFHIALEEDIHFPDCYDELSIDRFEIGYKLYDPEGCIFSIDFMIYRTEKERKQLYETSSPAGCSPEGLHLYTVEERNPAAAVEEIIGEFPHFMQYLCRKAILENEPFAVNADTIEHYGLSDDDADAVRRLVNKCNESIIAELRAHYETLAAIDCLRTKDSDDGK